MNRKQSTFNKEEELKKMVDVIYELLQAHKKSKKIPIAQKEIEKCINTLLSPDKWGEEHLVSVEAEEFAKKRKYNDVDDLSKKSWGQLGHDLLKDPKKPSNMNGKRGLILEHIVSRNYIMKWLKEYREDKSAIESILNATKCAVIHWKEDNKLNEEDLAEDRPKPAEAYYDVAKIKLKNIKTKEELEDWITFKSVNEFEERLLKKKR